ncbi:MAG: phosphocholine cytidylyltransferase family protein [Lamprobacter sp.]|uniref:phosphocholine cytidylyltransferase family protein n=1 Tax=Lamprobacter sp. TaxID=3100796 RepID=UPI002B2627B1|nr:phosphocholine cytidylyltransferase family protein [Lamprobacter sp.]MEA3642824.1 phosphocholine cytidylyltransferase family protein [Lamprobacter sp.]
MKAIILAAGRGSRMGALTEERPKCLLEVAGRSLLQWQLDALRAAGIAEIGIVTGYRRELLAGFGLTAFHNPRWADTNMVSSLACARAWLQTDACILSYGDIFYEPPAVLALRDSAAAVALTYDPNWRSLWTRRFADPLVDAESFRLNPDGTLAEIGQPPTSLETIEGQYMGLLRFAPAGWAELERLRGQLPPSERDALHMTAALQRMIVAGRMPITAVPYRGRWGEVDRAEDLALYQANSR